jgi:hypothetical protein
MKKLLLAALLALPLSAVAITEHEDGSVTLSKDEKEAVEGMVNHLLQQRQFLQMERGGAVEAIKDLQKKNEMLEKSKCI